MTVSEEQAPFIFCHSTENRTLDGALDGVLDGALDGVLDGVLVFAALDKDP